MLVIETKEDYERDLEITHNIENKIKASLPIFDQCLKLLDEIKYVYEYDFFAAQDMLETLPQPIQSLFKYIYPSLRNDELCEQMKHYAQIKYFDPERYETLIESDVFKRTLK